MFIIDAIIPEKMKVCKLFYFFVVLYLFIFSTILCHAQTRVEISEFGISFEKPYSYELLTLEKVSVVDSIYPSNSQICYEIKTSFKNSLLKKDSQIFFNILDPNENIVLVKLAKMGDLESLSNKMTEFVQGNCVIIPETKFVVIESSQGNCPIGDFVKNRYRISSPNRTYYSDVYIVNARKSTFIITCNLSELSGESSKVIASANYLYPEDYEVLLIQSKNSFESNDLIQANSILGSAIQKYPNLEDAYCLRASNFIALMKFQQAINDCDAVLSFNKNSINAGILKGIALYNLGEFTKSAAVLEEVKVNYLVELLNRKQREYMISNSQLFYQLGLSYSGAGISDSAIVNLEFSSEISSDSLEKALAYFNIARVNSTQLGRPIEAITYYSKAIESYPVLNKKERSEACVNRGVNYVKTYNYKSAIYDFTEAIEYAPSNAKYYYLRANANESNRNFEDAIKDYTTALSFDNYSSIISRNSLGKRGMCKLNAGQDGCEDLKMAISLGFLDFGNFDLGKCN